MTLRQHKIKFKKEIETETITMDFFDHIVFKEETIPEPMKLTKNDVGKKVWIADEPETIDVRLKEINGNIINVKMNSKKKLRGSNSPFRSFYKQEAVLHPDELTEERLEQHDFEIKDGRKS